MPYRTPRMDPHRATADSCTRPQWLLILLLFFASGLARGDALGVPSIEQLLDLEVTSASRKSQSLTDTAASVFVITREDIRRSGATSVPEALRLAPGVNVARLAANRWAVSIRGNIDRFANKLLVMLDGRTLYTPFFAGVFWEALDPPLDEIERIEVVRGPGASVWGANAVNGVINIITRHAGDSQGGIVSATIGSEERGTLSVRQGMQLGDERFLRLAAKARRVNESADLQGGSANDDAENLRLEGRWDALVAGDRVSISGNLYRGRSGEEQVLPQLDAPWRVLSRFDEHYEGAALVGSWSHTDANGAMTQLTGFIDYTDLELPWVREERLTLDLEMQRREARRGRHDWVWGLGYRRSKDHSEGSEIFTLDPDARTLELFSLFVQDEIELVPEHWRLILGGRLEHNDFTGFEPQPNLRLLWHPRPGHSLWTSLSRATRTPSRAENDMRFRADVIPPNTPDNPAPLPLEVVTFGDRSLDSEVLDAVELGYRGEWGNRFALEMVGFVHHYDRFVFPVWDGSTQVLADRILLGQPEANIDEVRRTRGFELAFDWRPAKHWRINTAYSYLHAVEDHAPHQLSARVSHDPAPGVELDLWLKHVAAYQGELEIPAYTTLDLRLGWQAAPEVSLALVGQNLLDAAHPEIETLYLQVAPSQVERSVYLRMDWQF